LVEIKFRYIVRHKTSGNIETKIYYLNQIEERPLKQLSPVFSDDYELLGRNSYVGIKDANDTELYYGDLIVFYYGWRKENMVWDVSDITDIEYLFNSVNERGATFEIIGNKYENPELNTH
jgi:hypothetical protein